MEKIEFWGYLASIATCISLLLYIIGNFISGILSFIYSKRYNGELFIWNPNEEILKNYYMVHNEKSCIEDIDNSDFYNKDISENLMITSENVLLNVKAFSVSYNKNKFKKEKRIFLYNRLSSKECILFSTDLPEGIPNTILEWETPTYMKGSMFISHNGKIGNEYENIVYKRTIKSFIFYLFRK